MKKLILTMTLFLCASLPAFSAQYNQLNVEIDHLGSHAGQVFFISLIGGLKTDCTFGTIYCPASNVDCKNYYSLVLAAKLANKKLLSIDYSQDPSSKYCSVDLVAIN